MIKRILLIAAIFIMAGLITLFSGSIAKLFTSAEKCPESKGLLFLTGLILYGIVFLFGIGYQKFVSEETKAKIQSKYEEWMKEQFRYRYYREEEKKDEPQPPLDLGGSGEF